jgi:hypothetical protein
MADQYFEYLTNTQAILDALGLKKLGLDAKIVKAIDGVAEAFNNRDRELEDFLDGTWVTSAGANDIAVGTTPLSRVGFQVQGGSTVITATAGGADIVFPSAFPHGLVCVVVSAGDGHTGGETVQSVQSSKSLQGFKAQIMSGSTERTTGSWRVDWLAFGF